MGWRETWEQDWAWRVLDTCGRQPEPRRVSGGPDPPPMHTHELTPSHFTVGEALAHLKSLRSQGYLWEISLSLSLI